MAKSWLKSAKNHMLLCCLQDSCHNWLPPPPRSFFCLYLKMVFEMTVLDISGSDSVFLGDSPIYRRYTCYYTSVFVLVIFFFPLFFIFYRGSLNWESRRVEEKLLFFPYTCNEILLSNRKEWAINSWKDKDKSYLTYILLSERIQSQEAEHNMVTCAEASKPVSSRSSCPAHRFQAHSSDQLLETLCVFQTQNKVLTRCMSTAHEKTHLIWLCMLLLGPFWLDTQ